MLQHEAGRLGEPSIGIMGRKLIVCCAFFVALLTAWGAATSPCARREEADAEQGARQAPGLRSHRSAHLRRAPRDARGVRRELKRLTGTRRTELSGAYEVVKGIATRGDLRAARLPVAMLELQRNLDYWPAQPLLANGQRIVFDGSELVWQEVPGQGIHLHPLANFGKLNAYARNRRQLNRTAQLLDELLAVAVPRGGGLAWEYYFTFDGGRGPVDQRPLAGHGAAGHRPLGGEARPAGGAAPGHLRGPRDVREAAAHGRARGDGRRRPLRRSTPSGRRCASPTASRSRWSASTTWRSSRATRGRRRSSRRATRRAGSRSPPTTPARGRCTRAGRSRASPTSATTRCCATSSPTSATARRHRSTATRRRTTRPTSSSRR